MASRVPTPSSIVSTPSALSVEYGEDALEVGFLHRAIGADDHGRGARHRHHRRPHRRRTDDGVILAMRYTPAFTIVAEWRYALTGVGASIAFGSQKWNGTWADFVNAASRTKPAMAP